MTEVRGIEPVGVVRTPAPDETVKASWAELESTIEVSQPFRDGLRGIDGFSHLIVVTFLDRIAGDRRSTLLVKPRGLLRSGLRLEDLPTIGVFACDSPARPNPIGISVIRLLGRDGGTLHVRGLDVFDGTPVLDLKPYGPDRVVTDPDVPAWHRDLVRRSGSRRV